MSENIKVMNPLKKLWEWNSQQLGINSIFYKIVMVMLGITIPIFIIALCCSHGGEIAESLGSFLGGIVGAGGAVFAVYLTLYRQKEEERLKVSESVKIEVTAFIKFIIQAIDVCKNIEASNVQIPLHDAKYIAKNLFVIEPVVYPAVADRIGLLSHPQATVEFYMRIGETKALLDAMEKSSQRNSSSGSINVSAPAEYVTKENASVIADSLITALQSAHPIISNPSYNREVLDSLVSKTIEYQINECFDSARRIFPNLESFKS